MPLSADERAALQALVDQKRREKTGQAADEDKHGRPSTYRAGCRCEACKTDAREKKRSWRQRNPEATERDREAGRIRKAEARRKKKRVRENKRAYEARHREKRMEAWSKRPPEVLAGYRRKYEEKRQADPVMMQRKREVMKRWRERKKREAQAA